MFPTASWIAEANDANALSYWPGTCLVVVEWPSQLAQCSTCISSAVLGATLEGSYIQCRCNHVSVVYITLNHVQTHGGALSRNNAPPPPRQPPQFADFTCNAHTASPAAADDVVKPGAGPEEVVPAHGGLYRAILYDKTVVVLGRMRASRDVFAVVATGGEHFAVDHEVGACE